MFRRRRKRGNIGKHKFCPVCGAKLELHDSYCLKCGYSFVERRRKRRGIKWKNIIIFIIIIIIAYLGIRYFNNQPVIPESIQDLLNITLPKK